MKPRISGCTVASLDLVAQRGQACPVIENLEDLSIEEVMEQFDVTREQVAAVLDFVAQSLRAAAVPAGARPL